MVEKIDIEPRGTLQWLLSAFIGAYNKRTDALIRIAQADPAALNALADKLKASNDALETAIKSQSNKGE